MKEVLAIKSHILESAEPEQKKRFHKVGADEKYHGEYLEHAIAADLDAVCSLLFQQLALPN